MITPDQAYSPEKVTCSWLTILDLMCRQRNMGTSPVLSLRLRGYCCFRPLKHYSKTSCIMTVSLIVVTQNQVPPSQRPLKCLRTMLCKYTQSLHYIKLKRENTLPRHPLQYIPSLQFESFLLFSRQLHLYTQQCHPIWLLLP